MGNLFGKRKQKYEVVGVDLDNLSAEEEGKGKGFKQTKTHTRVLLTLLPYLWPKGEWAVRISVVVSLTLMLLAKICTVAIPICYKNAVDILTQDDAINSAQNDLDSFENNNSTLVDDYKSENSANYYDTLIPSSNDIIFPVYWILVYGLLKFLTKLFSDLRDTVFVRVTQHALCSAALETFNHLHRLSLKFHLHRQTGGVLRAIERGTQGISFLLTFVLFNIGPTILEIIMVCCILLYLYTFWFALITFVTMVIYIASTLGITQVNIFFYNIM